MFLSEAYSWEADWSESCIWEIICGRYIHKSCLELKPEITFYKGLIIGLLALDFRKAFVVINFNILLSKFELYGCNDISLKWFKSYLLIDIKEFTVVILFHKSVD